MSSPSKRTPRSRALGRLAARLSFANVTAVLALFVALGGSSYAAIRVGSEEITDDSVRGRDIHEDTVRGTDVRDGDLKGKDVRDNTLTGKELKESTLATVPNAQDAQNAQTLAGKPASAFLGSDRQSRTGLIKLAHGETRTVASISPFTWKAACSDDGGGNTGLTVIVESTEADSFAADFGGGGQPVSPGTPATMFNASMAGSFYTIGFPLSAVAPSGEAPTGLAFVGLQVAGADCVINGVLWS